MFKISRKFSTILSLIIAVFFFVCCVAGLFVLPRLTEILINTPDNIGNRGEITQAGRTLSLICAYAIVLDMMLADGLLFTLLLRVRKGLVFTDRTVSLIRGVSWCCLGLCIPLDFWVSISSSPGLFVCWRCFSASACGYAKTPLKKPPKSSRKTT